MVSIEVKKKIRYGLSNGIIFLTPNDLQGSKVKVKP